MYLKDNDATNFNIWQDDHTKFKVPGPAVYKGSDSVAGNSAAPRTDDIIPCNCAEGPDASAGPGTPDQDKLVPRTSTPAGSATDCGADYVRSSCARRHSRSLVMLTFLALPLLLVALSPFSRTMNV